MFMHSNSLTKDAFTVTHPWDLFFTKTAPTSSIREVAQTVFNYSLCEYVLRPIKFKRPIW